MFWLLSFFVDLLLVDGLFCPQRRPITQAAILHHPLWKCRMDRHSLRVTRGPTLHTATSGRWDRTFGRMHPAVTTVIQLCLPTCRFRTVSMFQLHLVLWLCRMSPAAPFTIIRVPFLVALMALVHVDHGWSFWLLAQKFQHINPPLR